MGFVGVSPWLASYGSAGYRRHGAFTVCGLGFTDCRRAAGPAPLAIQEQPLGGGYPWQGTVSEKRPSAGSRSGCRRGAARCHGCCAGRSRGSRGLPWTSPAGQSLPQRHPSHTQEFSRRETPGRRARHARNHPGLPRGTLLGCLYGVVQGVSQRVARSTTPRPARHGPIDHARSPCRGSSSGVLFSVRMASTAASPEWTGVVGLDGVLSRPGTSRCSPPPSDAGGYLVCEVMELDVGHLDAPLLTLALLALPQAKSRRSRSRSRSIEEISARLHHEQGST